MNSRELCLAGEVDFDDFTKVRRAGTRRTGARLITAGAPAGRVASLGTGTIARWGPDGEALYGVRDAGVHAAIADGERLAATRLLESVTGTGIPAGVPTVATIGNGPGSDPGRNRDRGLPQARRTARHRPHQDDHQRTPRE